MDGCFVPYDALEGCRAEAPQPIPEARSLPAYFPPSRFLIFVFRGTVRHFGQQFHTQALGCVNSTPARSGHRAFRRCGAVGASLHAAVGASLPEGLSEAPQKASCFPSQSHLVFCFPNHHPLPLITGLAVSQIPRTGRRGSQQASDSFHRQLPAACSGGRRNGVLCFFHNYKNKMCSLQKTKNIQADQNK